MHSVIFFLQEFYYIPRVFTAPQEFCNFTPNLGIILQILGFLSSYGSLLQSLKYYSKVQILQFYSKPWNYTSDPRISFQLCNFTPNSKILLQILGFLSSYGILLQTLKFFYRSNGFFPAIEFYSNLGIIQIQGFLSSYVILLQSLKFYCRS